MYVLVNSFRVRDAGLLLTFYSHTFIICKSGFHYDIYIRIYFEHIIYSCPVSPSLTPLLSPASPLLLSVYMCTSDTYIKCNTVRDALQER